MHTFALVALTTPGFGGGDQPVSLNPGPGPVVIVELLPPTTPPTESEEPRTSAQTLSPILQPPPQQQQKDVVKIPSDKKSPVPQAEPERISHSQTPQHSSPQQGSGQAARTAEETYLALIQANLNSRIHYPPVARRLGQHGRVMVEFEVDRFGRVLSSRLTQKTPFTQINSAAMTLVNGIENLPPFPEEIERENWTLIVPIIYTL